jgi:hypothetical protein
VRDCRSLLLHACLLLPRDSIAEAATSPIRPHGSAYPASWHKIGALGVRPIGSAQRLPEAKAKQTSSNENGLDSAPMQTDPQAREVLHDMLLASCFC